MVTTVLENYTYADACSLSATNPENQNDLKIVLGEPKIFSHTLPGNEI